MHNYTQPHTLLPPPPARQRQRQLNSLSLNSPWHQHPFWAARSRQTTTRPSSRLETLEKAARRGNGRPSRWCSFPARPRATQRRAGLWVDYSGYADPRLAFSRLRHIRVRSQRCSSSALRLSLSTCSVVSVGDQDRQRLTPVTDNYVLSTVVVVVLLSLDFWNTRVGGCWTV